MLDIKPDLFYNKTTVIIGPSKTGKSRLCFEIAFSLIRKITQTIVVSGSEDTNHDYEKSMLTPRQLIHTSLTPELIQKIWQRQSMLTAIYTKISDIKLLQSVINHVNLTPEETEKVNNAVILKKKAVKQLSEQYTDAALLSSKQSDIESRFNEVLVKLYKRIICSHKSELLANKTKLTKDELAAVEFGTFEPSLLLILDDVTTDLKCMKNCKEFSEIFYKGRHNFITMIVITHDSKTIPPAARENAFVTIFTTKPCLEYHFKKNTTNAFTHDIKQKADHALGFIQDNTQGYTRVAFMREENTFYKIEAKPRPPFTLCDPCIVDFCKKIGNKPGNIDKSNPFYKFAAPHL